jgi:hypothetical protein
VKFTQAGGFKVNSSLRDTLSALTLAGYPVGCVTQMQRLGLADDDVAEIASKYPVPGAQCVREAGVKEAIYRL